MRDWIEYQLLKVRYKRLLAKCERQKKHIAMLERSRADMRKYFLKAKQEREMKGWIAREKV